MNYIYVLFQFSLIFICICLHKGEKYLILVQRLKRLISYKIKLKICYMYMYINRRDNKRDIKGRKISFVLKHIINLK